MPARRPLQPSGPAAAARAAERAAAAAAIDEFSAQVPPRPQTAIASALSISQPADGYVASSTPDKNRGPSQRSQPKETTASRSQLAGSQSSINNSTASPTQDFSTPPGQEHVTGSGPKGKRNSKAQKPRTRARAKVASAGHTRVDHVKDGDANDDGYVEAGDAGSGPDDGYRNGPSSSSKGKGKAGGKSKAPAKPRKSKVATSMGTDAPQQAQMVFYQVVSLRLYPGSEEDRADAQALYYKSRNPIPAAAADALIFGETLGRPWTAEKRKDREGEEEESASEREAKRRRKVRKGKAVAQYDEPETAVHPRETHEPARPTALSGSAAAPISLDSPTPSPPEAGIEIKQASTPMAKTQQPSTSKAKKQPFSTPARKSDEQEGGEADVPIPTKSTPFTRSSNGTFPKAHNIRDYLIAHASPGTPTPIPRQLRAGSMEDLSDDTPSDEEDARSNASLAKPRSVGSDDFRVQGVPLLSRVVPVFECHSKAYTTADAANDAALDKVMELAVPPDAREIDAFVEHFGRQYHQQTEGVEGEVLVSFELEPNVTHYRWDFFSLKVWVVRTVLGEILGETSSA